MKPFIAAVAALALVLLPAVAPAVAAAGDTGDATQGASTAVRIRADWTQRMSAAAVSTSSPVLVERGGNPMVVAGDTTGRLAAYNLATGAEIFNGPNTGFVNRAPLSSDGTNIYVPVAQDHKDRYPLVRSYRPDGTLRWSSNPSTQIPNTPKEGFMLSGLTLPSHANGTRSGVVGSSGHWLHGVNLSNGAERWRALNADSIMATPGAAPLFGAGDAVFTNNDTSREFPGDRNGGLFRIHTLDGRQVCAATQLVDGDIYAHSGYNNSSPAAAEINGSPVIVMGGTGPRQSGTGGNQVVAYDQGCRLLWASAPLAGRMETSPTFVDVTGNGRPEIVAVVAGGTSPNIYPRVYLIDPRTGATISDSGTRFASYAANIAYPPSISITSFDADNDGTQNLVVPARQGQFLVLGGTNLDVVTTIATNLVIQNTPIVTEAPGGVRITFAGYNGNGAQISSYVAIGATLGAGGWHMFGNSPQLTHTWGELNGPYADLLEGRALTPGRQLRATNGARLVMQHDGNLVAYTATGAPRWASRTSTAGSRAELGADGVLRVRTPAGTVAWSTQRDHRSGVARVVIGTDGHVAAWSTTSTGTRQLNTHHLLWSSRTGPVWNNAIGRNEPLRRSDQLRSPDGTARLVMQGDGNLVAYNGTRVRWQSGTRGQNHTVLGGDGNLAIYEGNSVRANYGIEGRGGTHLRIENSGDVVVANAAGRAVWRNGSIVK